MSTIPTTVEIVYIGKIKKQHGMVCQWTRHMFY